MLNLFSTRKRKPRETAPQFTAFERKTLAQPGLPPDKYAYATYDAMQSDAMIQTALTLKRLGVVAAPFKLVGSGERLDFIEQAFERMEGSPLTILHGAMDAFAKGWSIQELVFQPEGGKVWLAAVKPKDPTHFGMEADAYGRITDLNLRLPGETNQKLPREKFVIYRHRGGYSQPKGKSDLDAAYVHWRAKQKLIGAWSTHLERFAMPTVISRYARGVPGNEVSDLTRTLEELHTHSALLFPSDFDIQLIGGDKDSSTGFMDAMDFHNREIARAILGQTLTTDEGRRVGSLAMGKVHLQVLLVQLESLRKELADTVMTEQVIRPLIEMNFGPGPIPRFEFESQSAAAFVSGQL